MTEPRKDQATDATSERPQRTSQEPLELTAAQRAAGWEVQTINGVQVKVLSKERMIAALQGR